MKIEILIFYCTLMNYLTFEMTILENLHRKGSFGKTV